MARKWAIYYYRDEDTARYVFEQYKTAGAPALLLNVVWGDESFILHKVYIVAGLGDRRVHESIDPANPYEWTSEGGSLLEMLEYARVIECANMPCQPGVFIEWVRSTLAEDG